MFDNFEVHGTWQHIEEVELTIKFSERKIFDDILILLNDLYYLLLKRVIYKIEWWRSQFVNSDIILLNIKKWMNNKIQ